MSVLDSEGKEAAQERGEKAPSCLGMLASTVTAVPGETSAQNPPVGLERKDAAEGASSGRWGHESVQRPLKSLPTHGIQGCINHFGGFGMHF